MLHSKKWLVVFICTLALLITFSASTGSAHAASGISHIGLPQLKPNGGGPPGCNSLIEIGVKDGVIINYHGHQFHVAARINGWYETLNDGTDVFCNRLWCFGQVFADNGSTFPTGVIGIICATSTVTARTAGGTFDAVTDLQDVSRNVVSVCAEYTPSGATSPYRAGWGCLAGDTQFTIPLEL